MALPRFISIVFSLLGVIAPLGLAQQDQVNMPSNKDFLRRVHGTAVVGKYLYLESGEVSAIVDGAMLSGYPSRAFPFTASIPLDKSWTNATLSSDMKLSSRDGNPVVNDPHLWHDDARGKIYSWGGRDINEDNTAATNRSLWVFTTDGRGGGSWAKSPPGNPGVFADIRRSSGSASVVCGGRVYFLGGRASPWTDDRFPMTGPDWFATPGLLSYDLATGNWANDTVSLRSHSNMRDGAAFCLPFGGSDGLILFVGGASASPVAQEAGEKLQYLPMDRVAIYSPATKSWYEQATTGEVPERRIYFCSVGAQDRNTYEIFIYGGIGPGGGTAKDTLSDIWVLTLPGFHWIKVGTRAPQRVLHNCVVAGGRQMISVGGLPALDDGWRTSPVQDPWTQGFGVLDMTALTWQTAFDPNAAAYKSPSIIDPFYYQGGMGKIRWQSDDLRALFDGSSDPPGPAPTPSPTPTSNVLPEGGGRGDRDGLSSSDKIALGCGIGIGLPAAIAAIWTACFGHRRSF